MKTPSVLIVVSTLAASLATSKAEAPPKLAELNAKYAAAVEKATEPLRSAYLNELEKLIVEYTRQGDLDAALEVRKILEEMSPEPEPEAADTADELPEAVVAKTGRARKLYKELVGSTWYAEWQGGQTIVLEADEQMRSTRDDFKGRWRVNDDGEMEMSLGGSTGFPEFRNARLTKDKKQFVMPFGNANAKICKRVENP